MPKDDLKNTITVKTKDGGFKLLKDGKLEDLPESELMTRPDDLTVYNQKAAEGMAAKPAANFYFSVEDEHETRQYDSAGAKIQNQQIKQFIDDTADRIITEAGAQPNSQLKSVIISRLRDVRSLAAIRESLVKLNPGKDKLELIIGLMEKYKPEVETAIRQGIILSKPAEEDDRSDFKVIMKTKKTVEAKPGPDSTGIKLGTAKIKFEEVRYGSEPDGSGQRYQVTGAVDEIRGLSLADFRRFGRNPDEVAQKVMDKINLLEDESLLKKAEGIRAWQSSEAGKLYLAIGAEALSKTKSVEKAIADRRSRGDKYLTPEEFDAVADLNRRLSY